MGLYFGRTLIVLSLPALSFALAFALTFEFHELAYGNCF